MSKKRQEEQKRLKQRKRRRLIRNLIIGGAVVVATAAFCTFLYFAGQPSTVKASHNASGDLVFSASAVGSDLTYVTGTGGSMDLLAWRDSEGIIRTAYDTCEECFSTGNAHYTQDGSAIVCGSCGNSYAIAALGASSWGGCQPVSIPVEYRQDAGSEIVIPQAVLSYAEGVFINWRQGDYTASMAYYGADQEEEAE